MPVSTSYPGVYVEEIPSSVHTIVGVATSNTAFIGVAQRGPLNRPVEINGTGDFDRVFGGLWAKSTLSYAVRDFFQNGGSVAYVVRVALPLPDGAALPAGVVPARAAGMTVPNAVPAKTLTLQAANPGAWGNNLRVRVDNADVKDNTTEYNLTIRDNGTKQNPLRLQERFTNISTTDPARSLALVLKRSNLVAFPASTAAPTQPPDPHAKPTDPRIDPLGPDADSTLSTPADGNGNDGDDGNGYLARDTELVGDPNLKTGIYALLKLTTDVVNLLCIPPVGRDKDLTSATLSPALAFCVDRRAVLIVDPLRVWQTVDDAVVGVNDPNFPLVGDVARNAALFFPRLLQPDPLDNNTVHAFAPCGAVAGVFARTDAQRGVWKAPAGIDASLNGATDLGVDSPDPSLASLRITDLENGRLNPLGMNCLRSFPIIGRVVWGARTLRGADRSGQRVEVHPGSPHRAVHRGEPLPRDSSGWSSSPTTSPSGRRSASTSARSCRTSSARGPSRALARARRTSSSATRRPPPRTTSTWGSSTSSSVSHR